MSVRTTEVGAEQADRPRRQRRGFPADERVYLVTAGTHVEGSGPAGTLGTLADVGGEQVPSYVDLVRSHHPDVVRVLRPVVRIESRICHYEGQVHYVDAWRKSAHYAAQSGRYRATPRGAPVGHNLVARPWLRQFSAALTSWLGSELVAWKAGEATAVALAPLEGMTGLRGRAGDRGTVGIAEKLLAYGRLTTIRQPETSSPDGSESSAKPSVARHA